VITVSPIVSGHRIVISADLERNPSIRCLAGKEKSSRKSLLIQTIFGRVF
jgi:hypothetical protein